MDAIQSRYVNLAAHCAFETDGELDRRVGTILRQRYQEVNVRVRRVIAPCDRAVENREANIRLSPQRASQRRQQRPVALRVESLLLTDTLPTRADTLTADSSVGGDATQCARVDIQFTSQFR
jgi:hypothetical protein